MCSVIWCGLSWEAFATLFTGIAAVAGASIVGWRQMGISRRQTDILERQVLLQEVNLRHALFERRMQIYQTTNEFLEGVLRDGALGEEQEYLRAVRDAEFLFRPEVKEGLMAALRTAKGFVHAANRLRLYPNGWEDGPPAQQLRDDEHAALMELQRAYFALSGLFGDEIRLGSSW